MNCRVSVVVAVYAVEKYMEQCSRSLFGQTYGNIEYIFVDNNSPDDSIAVMRRTLALFPERVDDVRVIRETRQGIGYARFAGVKAASGDYIVHVDPDDWVDADFIEKLLSKAIDEGADVVYCDYCKEYEDKPGKMSVVCQPDLEDRSGPAAVCAIHRDKLKAFMCNKLMSRTVYDLETLIIPIRNMHDDIVLSTQILHNAGKVVHLALPLYHYRRKRAGAVTAGSVLRNRRASSEGLFYFYDKLPREGTAMEYIENDLVTRAAWYSLCSFSPRILRSHPEAVKYLSGMKPESGKRVSLAAQYLIKIYSKLISK